MLHGFLGNIRLLYSIYGPYEGLFWKILEDALFEVLGWFWGHIKAKAHESRRLMVMLFFVFLNLLCFLKFLRPRGS